jgi:hypothetical protein
MMTIQYRSHTVQSSASTGTILKIIEWSLVFAVFCELDWQIQFKCCEDEENFFCFSYDTVRLKFEIKKGAIYTCQYTVSREQLKFKLEEVIQLYLVLNTMGYHLKICNISYDDVMNSIQLYQI